MLRCLRRKKQVFSAELCVTGISESVTVFPRLHDELLCVSEAQMVASETQDKRNDNTLWWDVNHSFPPIWTSSRFISPFPYEERSSRVWRPLHLGLWHIHINRFNTLLKIAHSSDLGSEEVRHTILSCFHPPQAKEFLIDSAGKLRKRKRRIERQVVIRCWFGRPPHFT